MTATLTRWFIFSVLIALLPIWVHLLLSPSGRLPASLIAVCSHGELLLITAAISAAALGVLAGGNKIALPARLIAGGGCAVVLVLASLGFTYITSALGQGVVLNPEAITTGSLAMLAFGIVCSGSCVALVRQSGLDT